MFPLSLILPPITPSCRPRIIAWQWMVRKGVAFSREESKTMETSLEVVKECSSIAAISVHIL